MCEHPQDPRRCIDCARQTRRPESPSIRYMLAMLGREGRGWEGRAEGPVGAEWRLVGRGGRHCPKAAGQPES